MTSEEHYGQKDGPNIRNAIFRPDVFYKHLIRPLFCVAKTE